MVTLCVIIMFMALFLSTVNSQSINDLKKGKKLLPKVSYFSVEGAGTHQNGDLSPSKEGQSTIETTEEITDENPLPTTEG